MSLINAWPGAPSCFASLGRVYTMTLRLNTQLKIYYVSSIETILCLHYNGVVCRSVLTTEINFVKNSLRFLVLCLNLP